MVVAYADIIRTDIYNNNTNVIAMMIVVMRCPEAAQTLGTHTPT